MAKVVFRATMTKKNASALEKTENQHSRGHKNQSLDLFAKFKLHWIGRQQADIITMDDSSKHSRCIV